MNDFDRENFEWYTTASLQEQMQWLEQASIDELQYMTGLIRQGITEIIDEQISLIEYDVEDNDCKEANEVLNKFRLNK